MTALTPRKAQELKDAFYLARDLRSAFPQDALHVLEELYCSTVTSAGLSGPRSSATRSASISKSLVCKPG